MDSARRTACWWFRLVPQASAARVLLAVLAFGGLGATRTLAQDSTMVRSRLGPEAYAALRPALDAARRDSVPLAPLEGKALEGVAKQRSTGEIVGAVRRLTAQLARARALLRAGAPQAALPNGDVAAGADALLGGIPPVDITALRRHVPTSVRLEVPLAVLTQLVQRGVPADQARAAVERLLAAGVSQARMVQVPGLVDVALRVGAAPAAALGSALRGLGIPARPVSPRHP